MTKPTRRPEMPEPPANQRPPTAEQGAGMDADAKDALHRVRQPARIHLAGDLLEQFFVSAVVSVLGIRIYLTATGFPQVGGGNLHIAHMLWGGLAMLVALVLTLTFLGRRVRTWVAILGGLGFGTFIDEVGKFITADNDYLYRPAWIVIYVIFIVLFFTFTALTRRRQPHGPPAVATALDMMLDATIYGLGTNDREVILRLLDDGDTDSPLTKALRESVSHLPLAEQKEPGFVNRIQNRVRDAYRTISRGRLFRTALISLWAFVTVAGAVVAIAAIIADPDYRFTSPSIGVTDVIQLAVVLVTGALALFGILRLRRSRLVAYQWFRGAILISLLVGQPLAFFDEAVFATGGLIVDLICLGAFNYGISVEMADRETRDPSDDDHTPGFLGAPV